MARGRPALTPGTWGEINIKPVATDEDGKPTRWEADTRLRLATGETVRVRARGQSANKAKTALKQRCALRLEEHTDHAELSSTSTFSKLLDEYLAVKKTDGTKPQSVDRYTDVIEKHLKPTLGALRLNEITPLVMDQWLHSSKRRNVQQCRTVLNGAFGLAARYRLIGHNPMKDVRPLKTAKKEVNRLTPEEVTEFLKDLRKSDYEYVYEVCVLALLTGFRAGELLALNFSDIDEEKDPPVLTLNATISYSKATGNIRQEHGKTDAATRSISLAPKAMEIIRKNKERHGEYLPMVFPSATGTYRWENNFNEDFRTARGERWKNVTIHTLRRTFSSVGKGNLDPWSLAVAMGHADSSITEKFYIARDAVDVAAFADQLIPDSGEEV